MPCVCTYLKHQYKNNNARSRTGISKTSNETNGCKRMGKTFKWNENCRKNTNKMNTMKKIKKKNKWKNK